MAELPRAVSEALEPAFAEVEEFDARVVGAETDVRVQTFTPVPVRTAFRFGRRAEGKR